MLVARQRHADRHEYVFAAQLGFLLDCFKGCLNGRPVQHFQLRQLVKQQADYLRHCFFKQHVFSVLVFKIKIIGKVHGNVVRHLGSVGYMLLCGGNNVFQPFQLVAELLAGDEAFFNHVRFGSFVKFIAA